RAVRRPSRPARPPRGGDAVRPAHRPARRPRVPEPPRGSDSEHTSGNGGGGPMTGQLPSWRKLAAAAWSAPSDPQFYGDMDVDAAALLGYIERVREATGVRLTMT